MKIKTIVFSFFLLGIAGCSATYTAVSKKDLIVQSKMNKTIFLQPVSPAKRVAFIEVRNTSASPEFDMSKEVKEAIAARGYRITDDPEEANFLLQANVLHISYDGESSGSAIGSALTGGAIGGATGAAVSNGSTSTAIGGALVGGLAATVADAMVKDVTFNIITDIRLSQRNFNADDINENPDNWKRYTARIISTANQVNLKLEEAIPELKKGIANSIAGVF
ncbi:MAG: complement resistance protein TraT [Alphaproteobacteria bacterium]